MEKTKKRKTSVSGYLAGEEAQKLKQEREKRKGTKRHETSEEKNKEERCKKDEK